MRFIWKYVQRDVGGPIDHKDDAQAAVTETSEAAEDVKKNREHLKGFLDAIEKQTPQQKQEFDKKLQDWYQKGDKVNMRMGGISEAENDPLKTPDGYLKRHTQLSSALVVWDAKGKKAGGRLDFKGNDTAEHKVGLGDLLPPNVKAVNVEKVSGEKIYAIRAQNPQTGRIGYYEAAALAKGQYLYVAVHTGDKFEIARTIDPNDPKAQRAFLREHLAVYKKGAMEADGGEELYYDNKGTALPGTPAEHRTINQGVVVKQSSQQLSDLQKQIQGNPSAPGKAPTKTVEVNNKGYQPLTRQFLEQNIGTTEAQTSRWLVQTTFLGQKISVSPMVLPYLKEAESRAKAAGINYKLKPSAGGCQCYNHRGVRRLDGSTGPNLSKHSWGIALDINPGDNPFGKKWEDNHNPEKMSKEFAQIMQDCGFRWGNDFSNADPMHFELAVNPFTSQDILRSEEGKKGMEQLERFAGNLGDNTRTAWMREKESTQKVAVAQAPKQPEKSPSQVPQGVPISTPKYAAEKTGSTIGKRLEEYQGIIQEASNQYGVPVNLIMAVMMQESGGNAEIVSHAGAGGLMQLMPSTAKGEGLTVYPAVETTDKKGRRILTLDPRDDRMDPRKNIMAAVKLLGWLIKRYNGNIENALSAYNWGPGNMDKLLRGEKKSMPVETQKYAPSILATYRSLGGDTGSGSGSKPDQALV